VFNQAMNGTTAEINAWVPVDGSYELFSPSGVVVDTKTSSNLNVTFTPTTMVTGTWTILQGTGTALSTFRVIDFSGSFSGLAADQVAMLTDTQIQGFTPGATPTLQGVEVELGGTAPGYHCLTFGSNSANQTVSIPANTLTLFKFIQPWTTDASSLNLVIAGGDIQTVFRVDPTPPSPPSLGYLVVTDNVDHPNPVNKGGAVEDDFIYVFVQFDALHDQANIYAHGQANYQNPLNTQQSCSEPGRPEYHLTVQRTQ
jgi:hypothetical protein